MNGMSLNKLIDLQDLLIGLGYQVDIGTYEDSVNITATNEQLSFYVDYSEAGERSGYSLYDLSVLFRNDSESFIEIYSERLESNIIEDFDQINTIVNSVIKGDYERIYERSFLFWKRCYLKIVSKSGSIYLLRTRVKKTVPGI